MKNAICKKEMQLSIRKTKGAIGMLIFNLVLAAAALGFYYILLNENTYLFNYTYYSKMSSISMFVMIAELMLVIFIIPAITAGSIAGEREKQTLDLLFSTSLSSREIIFGKLMSSVSTLMLYLISTLPILFIGFCAGGLRVKDIFICLLYILVTTIYLGSMGIFFSSLFKKSVVASVCAYGFSIFLSYGIFILIYIAAMLCQDGVALPLNIIETFGLFSPVSSILNFFQPQIESISFNIADTLYFADGGFWKEYMSQNVWLALSVVVQLLASAVFLFFAAKRLKPVKNQK